MKRIKRVAILLVILGQLLCVASCSKNGNHNSEGDSPSGLESTSLTEANSQMQDFKTRVLRDEYADAIVLYNREIAGNSRLEVEAANFLEAYLSEIKSGIFSGEYDHADAEMKESTVKRVYSSTNCKPKNYDDLIDAIEEAFQSKVAYKSGVSFFESENYVEAIAEFSNVLPEDADYRDAIEKRATAVENYKNQVMEDAKNFEAQNDFMNAIEILKNGVTVLPDDVDLAAEINICEKNYITWIVSESEHAFSDYTKYEDALKIIRSGLQNFPGNQTLDDKREYYQSFAPVNLYDFDRFMGEAATRDSDQDTYKNEYHKSFWLGYGDWGIFSDDTDITFFVDGMFNHFSAILYGRSAKTESAKYTVTIYGDGQKLYENTTIRDNGRPVEISIDITGVGDLRIVMDREYGGPITGGIGMTEMIVQRTVK